MRTPRLNTLLALETPTRLSDGAGGYTQGWDRLGRVWAGIAPGSLRVTAQPGVGEAQLPLRITVRAAPMGAPSRPRPGQRFRQGSRFYPIASVETADRDGRYLLCLAHEETAL